MRYISLTLDYLKKIKFEKIIFINKNDNFTKISIPANFYRTKVINLLNILKKEYNNLIIIKTKKILIFVFIFLNKFMRNLTLIFIATSFPKGYLHIL